MDYFRPIHDSLLLQVPRLDTNLDEYPRDCSPPPRRCSYASTLSENSSISLNTSYQSLLFIPADTVTSRSARGRTWSCSDDNDTPPTNESAFAFHSSSAASNSHYQCGTGGTVTPQPQFHYQQSAAAMEHHQQQCCCHHGSYGGNRRRTTENFSSSAHRPRRSHSSVVI